MEKIKAAIFGFGNRGRCYAGLMITHPEIFEVVQVVDTNKTALSYATTWLGLQKENLYSSVDEWLEKAPKVADVVINCTMDQYHYKTTMPLFKRGYHVLLEKPISMNPKELLDLLNESKKYNREFAVCHVLRYAPFYRKIKEILLSKEIGDLVSMEMAEHVYIPHMLASYIRGKWKSEAECGSPMIMAKCCHDTDLMCWLNEGSRPEIISSIGSRSVFVPERKPKDASDKCMTCKYMKTCQYSAYLNVINPGMDSIIFQNAMDGKQWNEVTEEDKKMILLESDSLGVCAYSGPQDIVDHQVTSVKFTNGVTATLNMIGGTSYPCRTIHITTTSGEIFGVLEENKVFVRKYEKEKFWRELITYDFGEVGEGHSGGDERLIEDFIRYLITKKKSISLTDVSDSIDGHLLAIGADMSEKKNKTVYFTEDRELKFL